MNNDIIWYMIIIVFVIMMMQLGRYISNKFSKPKREQNIQKPGKLQRFILKLLMFLDGIMILLAVLGVLMKEKEMALASGGIALFFFIIIIFLKREFDISYEENEEYFILKAQNKKYKVFYENIIDWQPSFNEIKILDETRSDERYISVNIVIFKPEILLRKIADMAFDGKFTDLNNPDDSGREAETVRYLIAHQYKYLVEDYVEALQNKQK